MRIEGTIRANLLAAIASIRRLRGQSVHGDTMGHWRKLADHARESGCKADGELSGELEAELALLPDQGSAARSGGMKPRRAPTENKRSGE
jgi:hypothetical protein